MSATNPAGPQADPVPLTGQEQAYASIQVREAIGTHGEAWVLSHLSDEALVAEVKRRNDQRRAEARVPLEGQTYIGDRFQSAECQPGRCDRWALGDVLHRHWVDQETGLRITTPDDAPPVAIADGLIIERPS